MHASCMDFKTEVIFLTFGTLTCFYPAFAMSLKQATKGGESKSLFFQPVGGFELQGSEVTRDSGFNPFPNSSEDLGRAQR